MAESGKPQIVVFETETWEREELSELLQDLAVTYVPERLDASTAPGGVDADIISVFVHSHVDRPVLDRLPNLRCIATRSTGYDHVNLAACDERGIVVSNVPYYGENTVAEHTFALILALSRKVVGAYERTTRGDFSLDGLQGFDLKGKTIGVVGAGSIGLHVVRIARGFDMRVIAMDPYPNRLIAEVLGFQYVSLERLLGESDIVTLHAPSTSSTYHIVNRDSLRLMKRGSLLINTARGALVDTEALLWALDEGIIGGAGLDVLEGEEFIAEERQLLEAPLAEEKLKLLLRQHLLLRRPNVVVTPHIGFNSREALHRIVETTAENIRAFLGGHPHNIVNHPSSA